MSQKMGGMVMISRGLVVETVSCKNALAVLKILGSERDVGIRLPPSAPVTCWNPTVNQNKQSSHKTKVQVSYPLFGDPRVTYPPEKEQTDQRHIVLS